MSEIYEGHIYVLQMNGPQYSKGGAGNHDGELEPAWGSELSLGLGSLRNKSV